MYICIYKQLIVIKTKYHKMDGCMSQNWICVDTTQNSTYIVTDNVINVKFIILYFFYLGFSNTRTDL